MDGYLTKIVRSARRSLCLEIKGNVVIARVPLHYSDNRVMKLVGRHDDWIQKQLVDAVPYKKYIDGEILLWSGKKMRLQVQYGTYNCVTLIEDILKAQVVDGGEVREIVLDWYRRSIKHVLSDRCDYYSSSIGVPHKRIRIGDYKTIWGSCSSKGVISFNWRIGMAPGRVVDYLVVHELCHLIEANHSKRYWKLVRDIIADYRDCQKWLKDHDKELRSM